MSNLRNTSFVSMALWLRSALGLRTAEFGVKEHKMGSMSVVSFEGPFFYFVDVLVWPCSRHSSMFLPHSMPANPQYSFSYSEPRFCIPQKEAELHLKGSPGRDLFYSPYSIGTVWFVMPLISPWLYKLPIVIVFSRLSAYQSASR